MRTSNAIYERLVKELDRFRKHSNFLSLLKVLFRFLVLSLPILFSSLLLEAVFNFQPIARLCLSLCTLFVLIILLIRVAGSQLYIFIKPNTPPLNEIALTVGKFYKGINDRLANTLQMFAKHEQNRENYSRELISHSLVQINETFEKTDFVQFLDRRPVIRWSQYTGAVLMSVLFLVILFKSVFLPSFHRLAHPLRDYSNKAQIQVFLTPGDIKIVKGNPLTVKIWTNSEEQQRFQLKFMHSRRSSVQAFQASQQDTFKHVIRNIQDSLQYQIAGYSPPYMISVVELPMIRQMQLKLVPPPYTNQDPIVLEKNVGNVTALKGSEVHISGRVNKVIKNIKLHFNNRKAIDIESEGPFFRGVFEVSRDDQYHFLLEDFEGYQNSNPIVYRIETLADRHPFIQVLNPGKDIELNEDMNIPLLIHAEDDYGVSEIRLASLKIGSEETIDSTKFQYSSLYASRQPQESINLNHIWSLLSYDMLPNEEIVYYLEAFDNDDINGPKSAKTDFYRARFPSIYEIYQQVAFQQDEAIQHFENIYDKSQDLKKEIDQLSLQLKRAKELEWQERQQVNDALVRKQQIQKEIRELSDQLDNMVEKMEDNQLLSMQTLEKYKELQRLVDDVMTPELRNVMKNLTKAIENIDQNMINQTLEKLSKGEDEFQKRLDRAIEIFKNLKLEQQLDQAIKMTQGLKEKQKSLQEAGSKKTNEDILKRNENSIKEADNLESLLREIYEKMSETENTAKDSVDRALDIFEEEEVKSKMQNIQKQLLSSSDPAGVNKQSKQIEQSLQKMEQQLQSAKNSMSGQAMKKAIAAMRKASRDLIRLSEEQERNLVNTEGMMTPDVPKLATSENDLIQALGRVTEELFIAAKQNIFIQQKAGKSLEKAKTHMENGRDALVERRQSRSLIEQKQAMQEINKTVKILIDNMQQMMMQGSGSGMSFEQFMQQMQKLGQMQQGINQQTMGMAQQLMEQAAMSRMAAKQGQVRKSLQQLAEEAKEMSNVLGDLDRIVEDMKKVEDDFSDQKVNRQTIERQEKILSRMLDAQKSIREREFSKKRKAETGKTYQAASPEALPSDFDHEDQLTQGLLRAKKQGFSNDYLKLIEQYFRSLSERQNEKK
ncbi:hypothetical protein GF407_12850 [candidate division KSB1 bacterium]|nr:hypothetical protein [candidate division KSB1 bacterium]